MLREYIITFENMIKLLNEIADKIEDSTEYKKKLIIAIKEIEDCINLLFHLFSDKELAETAGFDKKYIIEVLQDLMCAIENDDRVLLVDVLRFGLCTEFEKACNFLMEISEELGEE